MIQLEKLRRFTRNKLEEGLSSHLTYHCLFHTEDVVSKSLQIAAQEGVSDIQQLTLLETAAWWHDTGYLYTYANHEEKGCELVREELAQFNATSAEIDIICEMIMATKIPQQPKDTLAQILCDADLDYLGREDFAVQADNLKKEWLHFGIINDAKKFDTIQIRFFESHHFFTASSISNRNEEKAMHLAQIKKRNG